MPAQTGPGGRRGAKLDSFPEGDDPGLVRAMTLHVTDRGGLYNRLARRAGALVNVDCRTSCTQAAVREAHATADHPCVGKRYSSVSRAPKNASRADSSWVQISDIQKFLAVFVFDYERAQVALSLDTRMLAANCVKFTPADAGYELAFVSIKFGPNGDPGARSFHCENLARV